MVQQSIPQLPAGLNQGGPCGGIAHAGCCHAPLGLKRRNSSRRRIVITPRCDLTWGMAKPRQTTLKITDRLSRGPRAQRKQVQLAEPVERSNSSSKADFDFAPMMRCTTSPSANTNNVGMLITW